MRKDYSGQTVTVDIGNGPVDYKVEGYWDSPQIGGKSWALSGGNFAVINYSLRVHAKNLPMDDVVLYGKIGFLGYLVHVNEIVS